LDLSCFPGLPLQSVTLSFAVRSTAKAEHCEFRGKMLTAWLCRTVATVLCV
jgi:hypothetical protein